MQKQKGKFIVLYGINNLGKTTQAKKLIEKLNEHDYPAEYLKYPIYDLAPSGPLINDYLRQGNFHKLSPREAQMFYALNRTQYEKILREKLASGINVVAEDYTGTGLSWGIGAGVDEQFLKYINSHLLKEDVAIMLDGERFVEGIERGHQHESNDELTGRVRAIHLRLAKERGWQVINANFNIEVVHALIWKQVKKAFAGQEDLVNQITKYYPEPNNEPEVEIINPLPPQSNKSSLDNGSIRVQKISPTAKLPTRAYDDDAGLDIYADENCTIYEGQHQTISTGIKIAIPNGCAGLIWDKSGLAKSGLHIIAGVIDSGYRGELKIMIYNLSPDVYHIKQGQKIAQLLIQAVETLQISEVDNLEDTHRSENNFGSSGIF